jgi:hypothetical protein
MVWLVWVKSHTPKRVKLSTNLDNKNTMNHQNKLMSKVSSLSLSLSRKNALKVFRAPFVVFVAAALIVGGFFVVNSALAAGPAPVDLLSIVTNNFAVLSKALISDVPSSPITGNVGAYPIDGAAIGIPCSDVTGTIYDRDGLYTGGGGGSTICRVTDDSLLLAATNDMVTAYNAAAGSTGANIVNVGSGELGGLPPLAPGLYTFTTGVTISTDVTLSGGANDVWIFQIPGTLGISTGVIIHLTGGAQASNIFWQVADAVTLQASSHFEGIILAQTNIAMITGASINGRLLAQTAVTLQSNTVTVPPSAPPTTGPVWEEEGIANGILDPGEHFFQTIQSAIDAGTTVSGDTIYVSAGTYTEQINITKSLTLSGAGVESTNIESPTPASMTIYDQFGSKSPTPRYIVHRGTNIPVVRITASNVSFSGFHVNLNDYTFWDVKGSYPDDTTYSRGVGILVDHVETVLGTPDVFTGIAIQNNKVDGLLLGDKGDGIKVLGSATATVTSNYVYGGESGLNFQAVDGPVRSQYYPIVTANNNTIYSSGPSGGPFGIGFWSGATGSADRNTIYNDPVNDGYALNVWGSRPVSFTNNYVTNLAGIGGLGAQLIESTNLIFTNNRIENQALAGAIWSNPTATITGNTIINCTDGFVVDEQTSGAIAMHNNSFSGVATDHYAVKVGGTKDADSGTDWGPWTGPSTITVDATNNWWGTASSTEIAAMVSDNVDFDPWYTNNEMTTLSDDTVTNASYSSTIDGQADLPTGATEVTLTDDTVMDLSAGLIGDAVTLNSGVPGDPIILTNSDFPSFSASIPDETLITGPAGWDGKITPPISGTPSGGNAPAGFSVGSTVISIGSPDGTLFFDKPVTILLAGVTGTVGYRPSGSDTWVQITNTCTAGSYDSPTGAVSPGECAISDGANTKILTYHFTTFGSLVAVVIPPTPAQPGGGSSANPPSAPTVATPATPLGQVLGAAMFNFASDLRVGMTGNAVTELQKRLTNEGVYSGPITGYFGPLTSAGVKAYQQKYGISQVGTVGPLTRAKLNASQVAGVSIVNTEAIRTQIASLQAQVVVLLQQLLQMLQTQVNQ